MESSITYHHVSRETWTQLETIIEEYQDSLTAYLEELSWWNKKVNLVSRNANQTLIWEHIRHSLLPQALGLLSAGATYMDAGTGGGLPGIPLALVANNSTLLLNDINYKKITAVHQITQSLQLSNIRTIRGDFQEYTPPSDLTLISKHSFKLPLLLQYMRTQSQCQQLILYKGRDFIEEIPDASSQFTFHAFQLDAFSPSDFYTDKFILTVDRTDKDSLSH